MTGASAVSVFGLGKLGSPMAACLASKGVQVIGVDLDERKVSALNAGKPPVFEPQLADYITKGREWLRATTDPTEAVLKSQISFIIVATPSEASGEFSLRYALPVCEQIGAAIAQKKDYHLVVMTSTVMPGHTGGPIREVLEKASGKTCGTGFGLCYSPEFIALGSVVRDFMNPDFLLIGESDAKAGALLEATYLNVVDNRPKVARMNWVNAELTKIAVNTYVTTKIAYANMLAHVCERLPGADVDVVTGALGMDSRIGAKYLKGAIGYGGPCFPRDNFAFGALARAKGVPALLAEQTDRSNRDEVGRLVNLVQRHLPPGGTVAILGIAYKPATDVIVESQGLMLAEKLAGQGIPVTAFDLAAMDNAKAVLGDRVRFVGSPRDCVHGADVVVITLPCEEYLAIGPEDFGGKHWTKDGQPTVIDCWRLFRNKGKDLTCATNYVTIGTGR
ncbi:MAG TPA: nucleotide sugar dehydrogenase [Gemmatales bacterium]|nr:nucleotide sugar dehydrogenase [Gemmatales bacterium]